MKKKGFTIAEIVIAMLVMGGVAMLLMPVLVKDTQTQVNSTALNKTYSMFQQAARSIGFLSSQGKIFVDPQPTVTFFETLQYTTKTDKLSDNLKGKQLKKYLSDYTPEFAIRNDEDKAILFFGDDSNTIVLKSGVLITYTLIEPTYYIVVDTNGTRTPNKVDKDIFFFVVDKSGGTYSVQPAGGECDPDSSSWKRRIGCAPKRLGLKD